MCITIPGIPELNILNEIGVARVSLGPVIFKNRHKGYEKFSAETAKLRWSADITENEITSAYVKDLVNKNY